MDKTDLQKFVAQGHVLGWSFTPLKMTGPRPPEGSAGKRPTSTGWESAPRESLEQALAWAKVGNVGLRTGENSGGLLVIDLDVAKPEYRADLVKALHLPPTVTAVTGSGGYHLYFQSGASLGNSAGIPPRNGKPGKGLAPAVDTRGDGGQVVFPGSVHLGTGKLYRWMEGRAPGEIDVKILPDHVLSILQGREVSPAWQERPGEEETRGRGDAQSAPGAAGQPVPATPQQNDTGTTPPIVPTGDKRQDQYGKSALAREMARVSAAAEGTRNHTLNEASFALGQLAAGGVVQTTAAENGLLAAALSCGLDRSEAVATIASGLAAGAKEPRGLPALANRSANSPAAACQGLPGDDTGTDPAAPGGDDDIFHGEGVVPLGLREKEGGRLVLSSKRTLPTADAYLRQHARHPKGRTLHSYAGKMFAWARNRYVEREDGAVRNRLHAWLHEALHYNGDGKLLPFPANPTTVTAALETLRSRAHVDQNRDIPFWLSGETGGPPPREVLPFLSGNLHIPTGTITEPTPDFFTFNALDFDFDAKAELPVEWLKFLSQLWPADPYAIELLQEWFGYCLVPDTTLQKMLLVVGPRRSGKGTLAKILAELVGLGNVAGPTTDSLGETFGLQQLIGKSMAIVSDARFSGSNLQTVVERLLCISGEDTLTIRRMYEDHVTLRLNTRFVFLSNELPKLTDAAGALAGRFLILTLTESFYGKEDLGLVGRLKKELPGILRWALIGWERLHARGHFVVPESSQESELLLHDLSSPIAEFVRERCIVGPEESAMIDDLFAAWKEWCEAEGRNHPGSRQGFGRQLKAAFPGLRCRRNHAKGRFYAGLGLGVSDAPPLAGQAAGAEANKDSTAQDTQSTA